MAPEQSSRREATAKPSERLPAQARDLLPIAMHTRHTGWVIWDWTTGTLQWSENGKRLMDFESDEEAGSADAWLRRIHPQDRARVEAHRHEFVTEQVNGFDLEYWIVSTSGEIRWLHGPSKLIYDNCDTPLLSVGFITNITERKRSEQELKECEAWLADQGEVLEAALSGATLETARALLVRAASNRLGHDAREAFYVANPEGTALNHFVGMPSAYAEAVNGFRIGPESLDCGLATHTGLPVLTAYVTQDPRWRPWLSLAE